MPAAYCSDPDCLRPARDGGSQCAAHYMRSLRGVESMIPIRPRLTPFQYLIEAALALADAEEDDDFQRAKKRMEKAGAAWLLSRGWSPPGSRRKRRRSGRG